MTLEEKVKEAIDKALRPKKSKKPSKREMSANKRAFLAAYSLLGNITGAAEAVGIARQNHYDWLADDINYADAFSQAKDEAADRLEQEVRRRAVIGVEEPIYQGGKKVGTRRVYSDNLLMFLTKGALPHKYKERHEMTGAAGGPLQTVVHTGIDLSSVSDAELQKELKKLDQLNRAIDGTAVTGTPDNDPKGTEDKGEP